ncbi:hypothetical protein EVAR_22678_1 [Eumeta japonica]|uniref:Uncharacterized protein n=1 Tax=Eumeta variegata TaxID=151549 RepID=A0A4C1VL44_EUMVA|nr:hypothetical protein EVAR_22678_1 [Eumeta japonica]
MSADEAAGFGVQPLSTAGRRHRTRDLFNPYQDLRVLLNKLLIERGIIQFPNSKTGMCWQRQVTSWYPGLAFARGSACGYIERIFSAFLSSNLAVGHDTYSSPVP